MWYEAYPCGCLQGSVRTVDSCWIKRAVKGPVWYTSGLKERAKGNDVNLGWVSDVRRA